MFETPQFDSVHLIKQQLLCETCFKENLCQRCFSISKTYIGTSCEYCDRKISIQDCSCLAICWCQSSNVVCRDCLKDVKFTLVCEKCNTNMLVILEDESYSGICEDGSEKILCPSCVYP